MQAYTINYSVPRTYQIKGGKLINGYETEFVSLEYATTDSVLTPSDDVAVIRQAISARLERLRLIHALGTEE
jgi:hypothetical protein